MKLQTQFSCRQLAFFPLLRRAWILWIPKHRNAGELGNGFLEQFQSLASQHSSDVGEPCDVPAGPRQAIDKTGANWIRDEQKHDRHGSGRLKQLLRGRNASGQNDVRHQRD